MIEELSWGDLAMGWGDNVLWTIYRIPYLYGGKFAAAATS